MLLEFFMERARIEPSADALRYCGTVPDLPELHVEALTIEECRARLAEAISDLLANEAGRRATDALNTSIQSAGNPAHNIMQAGINRDESNVQSQYVSATATEHNNSRFTEIIYEKRDWVARVTINRPELYNTYTSTTLKEMAWAFRDAALDDRVAVLVLTGAGDRAFCAGSDINQQCEEHIGNPSRFRQWIETLIEAHEALRQMGKPSIARINGIVAGGGNEWNLACDLAIAADHAKFVQIEAKVGTVASSGATQWLPLVVGERRAREILLTGEPISANKALLWGLVNDAVPYRELDDAVDALCRKLIEKFPESLKHTRQQLGFWKDFVWESTIQQAREWLAEHFASDEIREGMQALAERREIDYREFRTRFSSRSEKRLSNQRRDDLVNQFRSNRQDRAEANKTSARENQTGRLCFSCGAQGLPASFEYCGRCGARLA